MLARIQPQDASQQPLLYFSGDSTTEYRVIRQVAGSGPHEILFPFIARESAIGETVVDFFAKGVSDGGQTESSAQITLSDALQTRIIAGPVSDPVMLATSVSIAAAAETVIWSEGVTLPQAIPGTGSIVLRAGAGYLPAVLQCASALNSERDNHWRDGDAIVAALAAPVALGEYYLTKTARETAWNSGGTGHVAAEGLELAVTALKRFTNFERGLFWRQSTQEYVNINVYLNAKGAFLADQVLKRLNKDGVLKGAIGGQSVVEEITNLQKQWIEAVWKGLKKGVMDCRKGTRFCWSNCDALAAARLVLPDDKYVVNKYSDPKTIDLGEKTLYDPDYIKWCSVGGQADAALLQLRKTKSSANATAILRQLIQQLRVQGQTAYITASPDTAYPASWEGQAKALMALTMPNSGFSDHVLLPKLAAWVASGGGRPGFIPSALAFTSLALARYDATHGNTNVDAWLTARTGGLVLLEGAWKNPSDPVVRTETFWDALSVTKKPLGPLPEPLIFRVQGRGELSISAELRYMPKHVPAVGGIYQGITVEKVIEMADMGTGDRIPGAVSIVGVGDLVVVTIQLSTPDMLGPVIVSDLVPGGLEPVDPNVGDGAGLRPTSPCGSGSFARSRAWWWCWDPFASRETRSDRVDWFAYRLSPGTYTVRYHARAVTSGVFQVPGTAARATDTPEVMGLSGGSKFVVSATPVSQLTAAEKSDLLRKKYNIRDPVIKKCDERLCESQNAVCDGEVGECVCLDGSAMSNGKCAVISVVPSSQQQSIPVRIELSLKSANAERWDEHRGAIRKSMARTLLLDFNNADAADGRPYLSLGENDVAIDKIEQQHTNSAVVHASVNFWGPTGNMVATQFPFSMRKSIGSVISDGRLAQSIQETAKLGVAPELAMQQAVTGAGCIYCNTISFENHFSRHSSIRKLGQMSREEHASN